MNDQAQSGQLVTVEAIVAFALAGNARLTLESAKTGSRYTYHLQRLSKKRRDESDPEGKKAPIFVKVLTGPDNTADYEFLGTLYADGRYNHGQKSRITRDAPSALAFRWFAEKVLGEKKLSRDLHVWHEGACGRCGKPLTVPASIASGFGPECRNKI